MNCVDILKRDLTDAPASTHEILDIMGEGVDRIEAVTRRLLTLLRDAPLAREAVELKAVVEDALRFVRMRSRESGVAIALVEEGTPHAMVDVARLAEALANILDNAVYACRAGGSVEIRVDETPAGLARIAIRDTGEGIAPEHLPRLFEVFFTTKPVGEGSGLGLAIARRAVDEHGGTLRLESRKGEGTTVTIELPHEVNTDD
jgi:signal transduction histidine kinase